MSTESANAVSAAADADEGVFAVEFFLPADKGGAKGVEAGFLRLPEVGGFHIETGGFSDKGFSTGNKFA